MTLHEDTQLFADAIEAAARPKDEGGLGIKSIFIEKDYWICRVSGTGSRTFTGTSCRIWRTVRFLMLPK